MDRQNESSDRQNDAQDRLRDAFMRNFFTTCHKCQNIDKKRPRETRGL